MSDVLAVLLCRLFVTCAGVAVGIPDKGVCCSTAIAVASLVALVVSSFPPVCPPPAARSRAAARASFYSVALRLRSLVYARVLARLTATRAVSYLRTEAQSSTDPV